MNQTGCRLVFAALEPQQLISDDVEAVAFGMAVRAAASTAAPLNGRDPTGP